MSNKEKRQRITKLVKELNRKTKTLSNNSGLLGTQERKLVGKTRAARIATIVLEISQLQNDDICVDL